MDLSNTASMLGNYYNIPTEISSEAVYDQTQKYVCNLFENMLE